MQFAPHFYNCRYFIQIIATDLDSDNLTNVLAHASTMRRHYGVLMVEPSWVPEVESVTYLGGIKSTSSAFRFNLQIELFPFSTKSTMDWPVAAELLSKVLAKKYIWVKNPESTFYIYYGNEPTELVATSDFLDRWVDLSNDNMGLNNGKRMVLTEQPSVSTDANTAISRITLQLASRSLAI